MLFNSVGFLLFLPVVFAAYWLLRKNLTAQNVLLLTASYFFYACWDWRFLFLLMFSTALDFYTGAKIYDAQSARGRKSWLWLSICVNLGFLGVFKYYNFFIESAADALSLIGINQSFHTLNIILPVGISFYTFHGLSYVIDLYRRQIEPCRDPVDYSLFVSFFPLLVAGPIERATHLLPQIRRPRIFTYEKGVDGMRQILWGFFKKLVIADNCARYVNLTFSNPDDYGGSALLLGAVLFAVQIYCDFSGYSDIALGTARLFGIELLQNFRYPYFSRDIAEFWRRWHISLSSWFRDYLYIPLGGSRGGTWLKVRNTFIIFLVSGFWHGANWTFVFWGFLHALYFMPLLLLGRNRHNLEVVALDRVLPTLKEALQIGLTFLLTVFAWIFFRADTFSGAWNYVAAISDKSVLSAPEFFDTKLSVLIAFLFCIEWFSRSRSHALNDMFGWGNAYARWTFYLLVLLLIGQFMDVSETPFIYFQF